MTRFKRKQEKSYKEQELSKRNKKMIIPRKFSLQLAFTLAYYLQTVTTAYTVTRPDKLSSGTLGTQKDTKLLLFYVNPYINI